MKCQFCDQELPDGAKYCSRCGKQIICKECGEKLMADSTLCVFCGVEVVARSQVKGMNHIKYTESEHEKSFEATFSDETAGNVVETYARFLPPVPQNTRVMNVTNNTFTEVEEISNALPFVSEQKKQSDNGSSQIDQVFKIRGENEIYLHETSLKASSKVDYAGRLTFLYLLYQQLHGVEEVKRTEVNNFLERTGVTNDGSYRARMSKNKSLYNINNGSYRLCRTGEERAKEYLEDVFSDDKNDNWKLGDRGKTNSKLNNGITSNKINQKQPSNKKAAKIVTDLNLIPKDKSTLKDFMNGYNFGKSAPKTNLLFVYYLTHILKTNNVTMDHIYTCYRHMGISIPNNLYQCLVDTISKKGWIENISNISVTTQGINEVEHNLKK
jgi:hypothetical protein